MEVRQTNLGLFKSAREIEKSIPRNQAENNQKESI